MFVIHRSSNQEEIKAHLVNLFLVAGADGRISRDEFELLFQLGRKVGVTDQELARITAEHEQDSLLLPETLEERVQHLFELITMVVADHKVDAREVALCKRIATNYGIAADVVDQLVDKLVAAGDATTLDEKLMGELESLLNA